MPNLARIRLSDGPVANLKLASGCDRRCAFCAIPSFRGSFVSRPPDDIVAEAAWLGMHGVRELVLVSENSTSYGKDLPGGTRALTRLLPRLGQVPGIDRVRLSYLQPAELRPDLLEVIAGTPGVAPYFDLSFQHASPAVLRRMRRFGSRPDFLDLCARIRALAPEAGIRSNVIVGFPGETEQDVAELEAFLTEARLDAVGVFGYSDEDGTEAAGYPDKVPAEQVRARVERITALVDELMAQRAEDRIGTEVEVLVEAVEDEDFECTGRAAHQAPEVDGECVLERGSGLAVGDMVRAVVVETEGADLVVSPRDLLPRSGLRSPAAAGAPLARPRGSAGELRSGGSAAAAEHRQRAHRAPDGAGAVLPGRAAGRRRDERALAFRRVRHLRGGGADRSARRRAGPPPRPGHRVRHHRRSDRGQGADGIGAGRALVAGPGAVVGHDPDHGPGARGDDVAAVGAAARDHPGQPRRQGQDLRAVAGDRAVPAAAVG